MLTLKRCWYPDDRQLACHGEVIAHPAVSHRALRYAKVTAQHLAGIHSVGIRDTGDGRNPNSLQCVAASYPAAARRLDWLTTRKHIDLSSGKAKAESSAHCGA
ncbi:hypothetical protein ETA_28740 [Erwinia tasmaniensis Et1/99]|uniref:Uncharacterized protein n=1 Tax=Erwinia tasmaniensis (strain DSM 17950 / CFBP 7177 / CIP 109463 / NCPPB 4357 / Et1/99) TaxID=465817 RepID=B2VEX3_ERWT9|nr:hypothetical protein ETA_28740 [Erwinia tasmaniensis Et1/99]